MIIAINQSNLNLSPRPVTSFWWDNKRGYLDPRTMERIDNEDGTESYYKAVPDQIPDSILASVLP